jgi:hypothetical protein
VKCKSDQQIRVKAEHCLDNNNNKSQCDANDKLNLIP